MLTYILNTNFYNFNTTQSLIIYHSLKLINIKTLPAENINSSFIPETTETLGTVAKAHLSTLILVVEHHSSDGWQSSVGAQCSKDHWTLVLLLCSKITCFYSLIAMKSEGK